MDIQLKELNKKDEKKAVQFAVKGMHFDWYLNSKLLLNLYGRYFWYLETSRATQEIAAYQGENLIGVILAEFKDEPRLNISFWRRAYIGLADWIQRILFRDSVGIYNEINKKMFDHYLETNNPDGEIVFLVADPDCGIKGIGSRLLEELKRRESGKEVYLYTDNACTYQFYEHRGFKRVGETDIVMDFENKKVPLTCLMYSRML